MARQKTLNSIFLPINKEERETCVELEFATLNSTLDFERAKEKEEERRLVGRPRKELVAVLHTHKVEEEEPRSKKAKVRRPYTNWFVPSLWEPIFAAVKQHRNLTSALHYLQSKYKKPGQSCSVYDKLSRGSLYEWFTPTSELKEGYKNYVYLGTSTFTSGSQHSPILEHYPQLREKIVTILKTHRDVGHPLYASSIQGIIKAIIRKEEPILLSNTSRTGFKVGLGWTRAFIKTELHWTYRVATTAAQKLPSDWEVQGLRMTQQIAYLVKSYSIPESMVVDTDQTGIHLVPTGGAYTWDEKGTKHVKVHGMEDKRQITVAVSSSAAGTLLPFQVIFTGTTSRTLPPSNLGRRECEGAGWDLTFSSNHWSTLSTCQQFVVKILQPYRRQQIEKLGLAQDSKLIWLIDCWSVHTSKEFSTWMKTHSEILMLFVPANCTAVFQPADIILQHPFKHGFRQQFDLWTMEEMDKQLQTRAVEDIKMDFRMSTIKPHLCSWLLKAWQHVDKENLIQRGWEQCGIKQAFEASVQSLAMQQNMMTPLFLEIPAAAELDTGGIEEETDTGINMQTIMEESLSRVAEMTSANINKRVSALRGLARTR
jgi:hypothetical protein